MENYQNEDNQNDKITIKINTSKLPSKNVKYFIESYLIIEWLNLTHNLIFRVTGISDLHFTLIIHENQDLNPYNEDLVVNTLNTAELQLINNIYKYNPISSEKEYPSNTEPIVSNIKNIFMRLNKLMLCLLKDNSPNIYFKYIHPIHYKDSIFIYSYYFII